MASEGFKGWVAGFTDGDGSIGIHKQRRNLKQGLVRDAYYIYVQFTNTDKRAAQAIQSAYGGNIPKPSLSEWGNYPVYHLGIAGKKAIQLLREVSPYLVLKKELSKVCLELADSIARFKHDTRSRYMYIPESERRHREELYIRAAELNARGRQRLMMDVAPEAEPDIANFQLRLFGIRESLVEREEASPDLAMEIDEKLSGKTATIWDAIRVARLAPQLGVEKAIKLLL